MMHVVPCRGKQYDIPRTSFNFYQIVRLPQGEKIEKNEMGGACSAYGVVERCIQGIGGKT